MAHTTMKPPPTKLVDDLVVEILSRVPAKSLMRFQCISRAWLAFTSDIYYRTKLPATMSGLFYTISTWNADTSWSSDIQYLSLSVDRTIDTTLSFLPPLQNLDILDSCNGLLLCKSCNAKSKDDCYYVCNPATKKWITLPKPDESILK